MHGAVSQFSFHVCLSATYFSLVEPRVQFSYWAFHFNRGSPLWEDQGEHITQTVWEQIDNEVPWTATKKFPPLSFLPVRRKA